MQYTVWGVYAIQGKLPDGSHVDINDKRATRWFIRWRVNNNEHKRTLKQKGHAKTFRDLLIKAKVNGYPADSRGYPIDPNNQHQQAASAAKQATAPVEENRGRSFASYCADVWWPTLSPGLGDRNRAGHRKNMEDAINWLRYRDGDPRVGSRAGTAVGDSILLDHLDSDDLKYSLVTRRNSNDRVAGVNRRRLHAALAGDAEVDIELAPEIASDRTVRAFWVTLGMIVRSAAASRQADLGSLAGASALVPKVKPQPISQRIVPSIDEVFDLADAISRLGPRMKDGRPTGERFRALILAAGTLGPRPGELVAHEPDWFWTEDGITMVRFRRTEARFYDRTAGVRGRSVNPLKHRDPDDERSIPALDVVADALRTHLERGYGLSDRTFTSASGRAHLDWANMHEVYWAPACEQVFGGSNKASLAVMPPKTLRKAAITWWLDSGVSPTQAADWAGHSEDVAKRHYAGRVSASFAREATLLAQHAAARMNTAR